MGKEQLVRKWGHLGNYIEDDLKELNVEESKIKKIKDKVISLFEVKYWDSMINILEEWT